MESSNNAIKYFLYSDEQIKEKNEILDKVGKRFEPGIIIINGARMKFTQISNNPSIARFTDVRIVASGNLKDYNYTRPSSIIKEGN